MLNYSQKTACTKPCGREQAYDAFRRYVRISPGLSVLYAPSFPRGVSAFIITLTAIVGAAIIWACIMKMDDVVKTTALLHPAQSISTIKTVSGGEVLQKNYVHDGYVHEGDILLQLDVSADALELDNSKKLMERLENNILIYNTLLETIR